MLFEPRSQLLGQSRALTAAQRRDVRSRQIAVSFSVLPWAAVVHLLAVIGLSIYVIPSDGGFLARAWPIVAGTVGLVGAYVGFAIKRGTIVASDRLGYRFLIIEFAAVGLLYSVLAILLYPILDEVGDLVLTATLAAIIGAGTLATAMLRSLGVTWVLASTVVLGVAFWLQPGPEFGRILVSLAAYGCALIGGAVVVSGNLEARYLAERSAAAQGAVAQMLLDDFEGNAGDFVWETDRKGKFSRIPTKLAMGGGLDPDSLLGLSWQELFTELGTVELAGGIDALSEIERARQSKGAFADIVIPVRVNADMRWWKLSGRPTPGLAPDELMWRGVGSDVTGVKAQSDEIVRMGKVDALTGMPNRHTFWTELERSISESRQSRHRLAVAVLDLDNFKSVNDTLGHSIGDEVLMEVGTRLSAVADESQLCARLGGDEFAILFRDIDDHESVRTLLQSYADSLRDPISVSGTRLEIGCSIGFHFSDDERLSIDDMMVAADLALYAAKESGRGTILQYRHSMQLVAARRANLLEDIGNGVSASDIELRFLPQRDVATHAIVAVECEATWRNPRLGTVPAAEFMGIAEDAGLASVLGATVFEMACGAASRIPDDIRVAITLSARELESDSFIDNLAAALDRWGIPPRRVELQLTESSAISDRAKAGIRGAASLGASLTVDEFGTGFSTLASLSDLPFTRVRVDRSFSGAVRGQWPILAAVVTLVDSLGMEAVMLGVDSDEELSAAADMGVRTVQGRVAGDAMVLEDLTRIFSVIYA
ncbi:EAL domain-containing protein [Rhodococcus sp. IEGM 1379]|uniref:putative bifunctional diguanylate cyclase/phosphodiesterase n=1 Tax=Rhodococcus sp. IEGM 1379 TaxID=3047086 RepID=UPI0024B64842|nr:EAL domain-containing protein [Rhodococcus sp. IEGM 1379]MDI9917061.1 EAL domain-containing protein [Rhodococcus sp. IEGM 1379]